jgi:hypothetical protein
MSKSYREGAENMEFKKLMSNAKSMAKRGLPLQEVLDYFLNNVSYQIAMVLLDSKNLIPVFKEKEKNMIDILVAYHKKHNPAKEEAKEEAKPSGYNYEIEEDQDDVEAEPRGYRLVDSNEEYETYEETAPKKPIKLTPSVFKNPRPLKLTPSLKQSPSVFQPPPMPTKEEEYEAQRERNALARIRVFEGHTPVKSVF